MTAMNEMISNEQLFEKLISLEQLLNKPVLTEESKELWDTLDVARYFKVSKDHVKRAIVVDSHFPKPVTMPTQRNVKEKSNHMRWFAGDVIRYALKRKMV